MQPQRRSLYFPRDVPRPQDYNPTAGEIRRIFKEIRAIPGGSTGEPGVAQHVLLNGMTVGEFCLWYIANRTTSRPNGAKDNV